MEMALTILLYIILGTLIGCFLSLIPGLHIYNVAGMIIVFWLGYQGIIPPYAMPAFFMSLIVAFSIINTVPSMFLGAPDESAVFVMLPGQKYMMDGRGYEAAALTGVGGLTGIIILILLTPFMYKVLPPVNKLVGGMRSYWIMALVITYMLMSEWPKGTGMGKKTTLGKILNAWQNLAAGIFTFILSAILGFIVLNRTFVPKEVAFQNIMPAFVGLFAVSSIISCLISKQDVPKQHISKSIDIDPKLICRGTFSGVLGGGIAAFFPGVTGGIGGLLAGHATAQRDDRLFVISQGVSKSVYYIGAFMLFFVLAFGAQGTSPMRRGGMAMILTPIVQPVSAQDYVFIVATILIGGALAYFFLLWSSRWIIWLISRIDYRIINWVSLAVILIIVIGFTGIWGLFLMTVSTFIGLVPIMYGCRRSNCMSILLVPICLSMAGVGDTIVKFMGLY